MYKTGNPVPSSALEDMADNAQTFDALVTKTEGTTTDRLGVTRRVFQQILMDMGFQPLSGSFQTGATITARNQTLYDEVSHVFYSWGGTIPKTVPAGSTPATSGGIGAGAWVDRTDLMLRSDINIVQKRFACVDDMINDSTLTVGKIVETIGYYNDWLSTSSKSKGGNRYEIVAEETGTADTGSFINLTNGLQAKGLFTTIHNAYQFGLVANGSTDDSECINAYMDFCATKGESLCALPRGRIGIRGTVYLKQGTSLSGVSKYETELVFYASGEIYLYGTPTEAKGSLTIERIGLIESESTSNIRCNLKYISNIRFIDCVIYNINMTASGVRDFWIKDSKMHGGDLLIDHPDINSLGEGVVIYGVKGTYGITIKDTTDVSIKSTSLIGDKSKVDIRRGEQNSDLYIQVSIDDLIIDSSYSGCLTVIGASPKITNTFLSGGRINLLNGLLLDDCTEGSIVGLVSRFNGKNGLRVSNSNNITFSGCHFNDNKEKGVSMSSCDNIKFIGGSMTNAPAWYGGSYTQQNGFADEASDSTNISIISTNISGNAVGNIYLPGGSNTIFDVPSIKPSSISGGILNLSGTGSPEGAVSAPVGSTYTRKDGGVGSTLYVKESGTGNTGWSAK